MQATVQWLIADECNISSASHHIQIGAYKDGSLELDIDGLTGHAVILGLEKPEALKLRDWLMLNYPNEGAK